MRSKSSSPTTARCCCKLTGTQILSNTGDFEGLFNYNSATKSYYGTLAPFSLARFSQGGPNERQNREFTDFTRTTKIEPTTSGPSA